MLRGRLVGVMGFMGIVVGIVEQAGDRMLRFRKLYYLEELSRRAGGGAIMGDWILRNRETTLIEVTGDKTLQSLPRLLHPYPPYPVEVTVNPVIRRTNKR